jgi:hypothetical protein
MTMNRSHEARLKTIFGYFVDVVRINIFITTKTGKSMMTPEPNPYGWNLLADAADIQTKFRQNGDYLEYIDPFGLHHFAIPIRSQGYVVIGPLIINKKLERVQYQTIALKLNRDPDDLLDSLQEIRVVSQNQLKSIIDLISEAKEFFIGEEPQEAKASAGEILNTALKSLLDAALGMAKAQSGSIMLYNAPRGLTVHVSKGINPQFVTRKPIKLGEGISGYALEQNRTFVLTDKADDNRIAHLLKRKEIKQSIVMPFESQDKNIRGVLNLNIQNGQSLIKGTDRIIKNLAQATAMALQTL